MDNFLFKVYLRMVTVQRNTDFPRNNVGNIFIVVKVSTYKAPKKSQNGFSTLAKSIPKKFSSKLLNTDINNLFMFFLLLKT